MPRPSLTRHSLPLVSALSRRERELRGAGGTCRTAILAIKLIRMVKWLAVILVVLVALGGAAASLAPRLKPKPPEWKTEKVTRGDLTITVTSTGTVGPIQTVLIGSQISGRVKSVNKVSNDIVKKNDVLAELDTDLLDAEKRSAEVRLVQARAALSQLKVERENLEIRKVRHKAAAERKKISVERAKGSLELAMKNLKRVRDLIAVDAATQSDLDIRALEEANAQRDLRLQEIELSQSEVDMQQIEADAKQLNAREEQANADILQAESQLARVMTNLGYARILSPIDGVVLQHLIEPGQTIAASFQTPNLFKIATDLKDVRIDAQIDEADVGRILSGQDVTFDVDAYRNDSFNGKVALVRLQSESKGNLVTYPVLVQAQNVVKEARDKAIVADAAKRVAALAALPGLSTSPAIEWKLLPGMTANLKFVVDQRKNVQLLPSAALRFIPPLGMAPAKNDAAPANEKKAKKGTRGTVFVANAMGMLERRNVIVGENDGDNFELLEGDVKEGDAIVTGMK
ncbi:MAG TPA: HlyD family efflux transporter periplasmic adaptor subunit [Planctomycetota bacterium]|nr:HlyD family efflux transporter periplasmic adaptor subunit [Planctomycetota bacterium]